MQEIRILVTGAGRRVELLKAFRQAALVLHKDLKLYGADMAGTAPALCYCDYTRRVVAMRDPGYIDQLLSICAQDQIDLLMPTIDTDLLVLAENRQRFADIGVNVLISRPEMIRICRDKNLTSQFFVDCGLQAPMPVHDYRTYQAGFPAFIKPKDGSSSINAFKVHNEKELQEYAERIGEYVVQPFVDGTEYTIDVFCDFTGKPLSIVPRERMAVRAGEVLKTKICMDPRMIEEAGKLLAVFRPCGPVTIQLIREQETGTDYFIEINPRYGGGAPLSMKAGARSAEMLLQLLAGEPCTYAEQIADGAIYSRFDDSVCIDAGTRPQAVRGVIFDLDDTLYAEREYVRSGYRAVARYLQNDSYADKLWQYFAKGRPAIDGLLTEIGRMDEKENCLDVYRTHQPDIHLYPGARELIEQLRKQGIRVGILTDGRPDGQRKKLRALHLDELVEDICITDELGGVQFRKPCDIAYRILQTKWRLAPEQIVYVGDNARKDFQAPAQLGMQHLHFDNPEGLYREQNDGIRAAQQDAQNGGRRQVSGFAEVAEQLYRMTDTTTYTER